MRPQLNHEVLKESRGEHRGDHTRRRILDAAIEVFASEGYGGASTRVLAARAGVNQPAIQYYFASKEGLYRAAAARIGRDIEERMEGPDSRIAVALLQADALSDDQLYQLLFGLLDGFASLILEEDDGRALFIARAEIENFDGLTEISESIVAAIMKPAARIVGRILGRPEDDEEVVIRTLAILGQVLNFKNRCLGKVIRRAMGLEEFGPSRRAAVTAILHEHTQTILQAAKAKGT